MKITKLAALGTAVATVLIVGVAHADVKDGSAVELKNKPKLYLVQTANHKIKSVKSADLDSKMADSMTKDGAKAYWQSKNDGKTYYMLGKIKSGQYICVEQSAVKHADDVASLKRFDDENDKMTQDKMLDSIKGQDLSHGQVKFNIQQSGKLGVQVNGNAQYAESQASGNGSYAINGLDDHKSEHKLYAQKDKLYDQHGKHNKYVKLSKSLQAYVKPSVLANGVQDVLNNDTVKPDEKFVELPGHHGQITVEGDNLVSVVNEAFKHAGNDGKHIKLDQAKIVETVDQNGDVQKIQLTGHGKYHKKSGKVNVELTDFGQKQTINGSSIKKNAKHVKTLL